MADAPTILITGFGPFRNHNVNASWEAVKNFRDNYRFDGYKLICEEISVSYCAVDKHVPQLWQTYNPKVVIHVGVSHLANAVTIEKQAFRIGYDQNDCLNNAHPTGCVIKDGNDILRTQLDVQKICHLVQKRSGIKCEASENAGRYLCEYTYYTSLNMDCTRVLFVHVPMLDEPYSKYELATALYHIVSCVLHELQIESNEIVPSA